MALSGRKNWLARAWQSAFAPIKEPEGFYRHRALVRLTHWINALCILFLLGSGLNIFNAHPALYWGDGSNFPRPALMLGAYADEFGMVDRGVTAIGGHEFTATGVLGASNVDGQLTARGFPDWATLPGPSTCAP